MMSSNILRRKPVCNPMLMVVMGAKIKGNIIPAGCAWQSRLLRWSYEREAFRRSF
jgi:hypothetical protein